MDNNDVMFNDDPQRELEHDLGRSMFLEEEEEHEITPSVEAEIKKAQYVHKMLAKIIATAYVNAADKDTCFSTLFLLLSELEANDIIVGAATVMEMAQAEIFTSTHYPI